MSAETSQISILNANKGITNIVPQKAINTDLRRVTDQIFKILSHHYGPYSGFAAKDDGQPLKESTFTKDGIGIVRATTFVAPQEEWVRKTIAYIGDRMESSVGDGTTSAMMFTCAMLKHMAEHIHELKPCNYGFMRRTWDKFIDMIMDYITDHFTVSAFTQDKDGNKVLDYDKVASIVRHQVYTSSHGDKALAHALSEMYRNLPQEQWERMTYERSRYETDKDYEVTKSDGQYQLKSEVMTTSMLNKDLCTWYESTNSTVVILNDCIRVTHPEYPGLLQLIDESTKAQPVVIVCHTVMDNDSYQQINEKIDQCAKEGRPIAIFTSKPINPKVNDYVALQSIAGVDITQYDDGKAVVIKGCRVRYKNKQLSIDGLYQEPEGWNKIERPHVTDGKHSQYTDVLETWKRTADHYNKNAQTREDRELANYFCRMYIKLRYTKVMTVVVGGKAYDNIAFVDVLDDAVKAASRALTNGVTLGNNRALYLASKLLIKDVESKGSQTSKDKLVVWYANRVIEALDDIAKVVLERIYEGKYFFPWEKKDFVKWWFTHSVDLLLYDTKTDRRRKPWNEQRSFLKCEDRDDVVELFHWDDHPVICQPNNSDKIMLERFGEVALKFILTEHVVIANGAYVSKGNR